MGVFKFNKEEVLIVEAEPNKIDSSLVALFVFLTILFYAWVQWKVIQMEDDNQVSPLSREDKDLLETMRVSGFRLTISELQNLSRMGYPKF